MCNAILKAIDVIKKSRVELSSYLASGRGVRGGGGECSARFTTTEPMQALYQVSNMKAELEDMCQEEDDWHWQEDQDWHWKEKEEKSGRPGKVPTTRCVTAPLVRLLT